MTAPLAALLASHPEECADVLALLCVVGRGSRTPTAIAIALLADGDIDDQTEMVRSILDAIGPLDERKRMAIARMGAAAWLRERVGVAVVDETTTDGEGEQR